MNRCLAVRLRRLAARPRAVGPRPVLPQGEPRPRPPHGELHDDTEQQLERGRGEQRNASQHYGEQRHDADGYDS
eukprot:1388387-Pyramimonas_sp.AAC.1